MTPDNSILLLDVGGTFIKCSDGREIPVNSDGTRGEIVSSLREAAGNHTGLAVAIPGPFDYSKGTFLMKHKYAAVYGENFASLCGISADAVSYEHDVIAMLRGEMACGNGKGFGRVALLTLGTGLGFALSLDGSILRNEKGSPLVPAYNIPYEDGILEDYVSKRGVLRLYGEDDLSVKEIAQRAVEGEKKASDAFDAMGTVLGSRIAPLLKEYGVERLLFGGQISRSCGLFAPSVQKELEKAGLEVSTAPVSDFDSATFNGLKTIQ